MRRLTLVAAVAVSIATSQDPAPKAPAPKAVSQPDPVPEPAPRPEVKRMYVTASSLNLRAEPDSSGAIVAKLPINVEVREDRVEGDWAHVTTARGLQGWVGKPYISDTPLALDEATTKRDASDAPEDKLAWAQRAAALRPVDPEVLGALEQAYRALDRTAEADQVKARIGELSGSKFEAWFPSALRAEMDVLQAELDAVSSLDDFVAARNHGLEVSRKVSETLDGLYDFETSTFAGESDLDWLDGKLPGQEIQWGPEGLGAGTVLATAPWKAAAAKTPSPEDDRMVALNDKVYGHFTGGGWEVWNLRNWDYGGCSAFGSGVHVDVLKATDALTGVAVFAEQVDKIRRRAIQDIVEDDTEYFPFCKVEDNSKTPGAKLTAELDRILAEVKLTEAEKALLEKRKQVGWPHNP